MSTSITPSTCLFVGWSVTLSVIHNCVIVFGQFGIYVGTCVYMSTHVCTCIHVCKHVNTCVYTKREQKMGYCFLKTINYEMAKELIIIGFK